METSEIKNTEYAAWIGLDWASEKHVLALQSADSNRLERCTLEQKPEALNEWFVKLLARFPGKKVALAIEQRKGAVIHFLLGFDFVHIFPINPKSLKNYREALYPSGAKDDPVDAELLLRFLKGHSDRLKPWVPDDPDSRALLRLVEFRRKTVGARGSLTNKLGQILKEYFPQALTWAGELDTIMACDFLTKWPTLEKLQKTKPEKIRKFYTEHGSRSRELNDQRLNQISAAVPLTKDTAVISTSVLMVQTIVGQLRPLFEAIRILDGEIEKVFKKHPDFEIFDSFPGAGDALAPRLQAAVGSDRSRFESPEEIQNYSGISPVTDRSGKTTRVYRRLACSKFVKQSFHEFAGHSLGFCDWARAYYDMQRARGKGHHAAVRAVAYKWIRIIFRCWKDRVPYNNTKYMESLQRKKAPCLAYLPAAA